MLNWLRRKEEEYDPSNDEKFRDRAHAGQELAQALREYAGQDILVLGIPRGGVETAWWVKSYLKAQWSVLIANKLRLPNNEEMGVGAVAEDGSTYIDPSALHHVSDLHITTMKSLEQLEVNRRLGLYRRGAPIPNMEGRTVILVDDGIAMGSTMRVGIELCKKRKAAKIVVAAPIGPKRVVNELQTLADEVVVLHMPKEFRNLRQGYEKLHHLTDENVWDIITRKQAQAQQRPQAGQQQPGQSAASSDPSLRPQPGASSDPSLYGQPGQGQHKPQTVPPQEPGASSDPSLYS